MWWRQYNLGNDCCGTNELISGVRYRENDPLQKRCTRPLGYLPPARVRDQNWAVRNIGGGCAATCCMSFLRHQRSIVRWGYLYRGRSVSLLRPRLLTVSMSRSWLFLGGMLSSSARLRFTGCHQNAIQRSCRSRVLHRTMNGGLFACLSKRIHSTPDSVRHFWNSSVAQTRTAATSALTF